MAKKKSKAKVKTKTKPKPSKGRRERARSRKVLGRKKPARLPPHEPQHAEPQAMESPQEEGIDSVAGNPDEAST